MTELVDHELAKLRRERDKWQIEAGRQGAKYVLAVVERDEARAEVMRLQQLIRDIPKARMDDDMRLDPMWIVEYAAWLRRAVGLDE